MIKKIFIYIFCISLVYLTFASCSFFEKNVEISMVVDSDPENLDAQIVNTDSAKTVITNCFEGLVRLDENGKIVPGAAERWEISEDGLNYTFYLRKDAKWKLIKSHSDIIGQDYIDSFDTRVTADDFVFAFERALDPVTDAPDSKELFCIKGAVKVFEGKEKSDFISVHAQDDFTLKISLEYACDNFLYVLTTPVSMPCNREFFILTKSKYGLSAANLLCNGAFYLSSWSEGKSLTMLKNDVYKGISSAIPSKVSLIVNNERESVMKKLVDGSYSCAAVKADERDTLKDKFDFLETKNTTVGLLFNSEHSSLSSINIRNALAYASSWNELELSDGKNQARGVVPAHCKIGEQTYRSLAGEVNNRMPSSAKAIELWEKGLTELKLEKITLSLLCRSDDEIMMRGLIQQWQKTIGISLSVSVEAVENQDELLRRMSEKDFDIAVFPLSSHDTSPLSVLEGFVSDSNENYSCFSDDEYDSIYLSIEKNHEKNHLIDSMKKLESILIDQSIFIPVYYSRSYIACAKDVKGIFSDTTGCAVYFLNGDNR